MPTLNIGAAYDDNIFLRHADRQDDTIVSLVPDIGLHSDWSRHQLNLDASATISRYLRHPDQNTNQYQVSADGQLDVLSTMSATGSVAYKHQAEERGTPGDNVLLGRFVEYDLLYAALGVSKQVNRVIFSFDGNVSQYRYEQLRAGGVIQDQSFRDRSSYDGTGRLAYQISSLTSVYVLGALNQIKYKDVVGGTDRGSSGYSILSGMNFEVSPLLHGELGIGYLRQSFDSKAFSSFHGLNYNANIQYSPTALTSLTFTASRAITDSALIGVPGVLTSTLSLGLNHDLLRNLMLTADISRSRDTYRSIDRHLTRYVIDLGAKMVLNRHVSVKISFSRREQANGGSGFGLGYTGNKAIFGLVVSD